MKYSKNIGLILDFNIDDNGVWTNLQELLQCKFFLMKFRVIIDAKEGCSNKVWEEFSKFVDG